MIVLIAVKSSKIPAANTWLTNTNPLTALCTVGKCMRSLHTTHHQWDNHDCLESMPPPFTTCNSYTHCIIHKYCIIHCIHSLHTVTHHQWANNHDCLELTLPPFISNNYTHCLKRIIHKYCIMHCGQLHAFIAHSYTSSVGQDNHDCLDNSQMHHPGACVHCTLHIISGPG